LNKQECIIKNRIPFKYQLKNTLDNELFIDNMQICLLQQKVGLFVLKDLRLFFKITH